MLTAVCLGTNNLEAAGKFYDELLATINMVRMVTAHNEIGYGIEGGRVSFWVVEPFNEKPATFGNGTQFMLQADSHEVVKKFHETALRLGGTDEGAPGPRDYTPTYYGAYCRDLDGNKLHVFDKNS